MVPLTDNINVYDLLLFKCERYICLQEDLSVSSAIYSQNSVVQNMYGIIWKFVLDMGSLSYSGGK